MKVYIAGKITGDSDYMRICFAMMDTAEMVVLLPDYKQSKGAQLEYMWCQYVGKPTMLLASKSLCREGDTE